MGLALTHLLLQIGGLLFQMTEILRFIVVGQRLEHDVADYPRLGKRLFRNRGRRWNLVDIDAIVEPDRG